MGQGRENTENAANGPPVWHCLGRLAFDTPMVLACLLLALGDVSGLVVTILVVGLWLWLATSAAVSIVRFWKAMEESASKQEASWDYIYDVPRICAWTSLPLLAVATGALFAAGEPVLARTMTLFLFLWLLVELARDEPTGPNKETDAPAADSPTAIGGWAILRILIMAGSVWLALGSPPVWAISMILTWIWIISLLMVVAGSAGTFACKFGPGWRKDNWERLQRSGAHPGMAKSWPEPPLTPEPPRTARQQFGKWLWRVGLIAVTWALWTAGQPLLAGLYLLGWMVTLSANVLERRLKHGDSARIDFFARAVAFVIWWPLLAAGVVSAVSVMAPLLILLWFVDLFVPNRSAGMSAHTYYEREERLERARIRRAAASFRLREAFDQPGGFVYFLYCEPHQRKHFLGEGGLLAGLGERVVARDWRKDVIPARKEAGWTRFQQTPEGALLYVNGIGSMRKDMPFIAVAPSRGIVQVFPLGEAYRARRRDKGAALATAEVEIKAAIEVVLGTGVDITV